MNYGKHARILFPQFSIFAVLIMCMCQECWDRADLAYARLGRRGCLWLRGLVPVWRARGSANSEHGINGRQTMRTHHIHTSQKCVLIHTETSDRGGEHRCRARGPSRYSIPIIRLSEQPARTHAPETNAGQNARQRHS